MKTLPSGKHTNKTLEQVAASDMSYIRWMSEQSTMWGKKEWPEAAKALLQDSRPAQQVSAPAAKTYAKPTSRRECEKLSWMASKGYGDAKSRMLASRDFDGLIVFEEEDEDGKSMGEFAFAVRDDGTGFFAGDVEYARKMQHETKPRRPSTSGSRVFYHD